MQRAQAEKRGMTQNLSLPTDLISQSQAYPQTQREFVLPNLTIENEGENPMLIQASHRMRDSCNFITKRFNKVTQPSAKKRQLGTDISNTSPMLSPFKGQPLKSMQEAEMVINELSIQVNSLQEELDFFVLENDRLKL